MRFSDLKIVKKSISKVKKASKGKVESKSCENSLEEKIRIKAYELYLNRGSENGHDLEDWIEAKKIVEAEAGLCTCRN